MLVVRHKKFSGYEEKLTKIGTEVKEFISNLKNRYSQDIECAMEQFLADYNGTWDEVTNGNKEAMTTEVKLYFTLLINHIRIQAIEDFVRIFTAKEAKMREELNDSVDLSFFSEAVFDFEEESHCNYGIIIALCKLAECDGIASYTLVPEYNGEEEYVTESIMFTASYSEVKNDLQWFEQTIKDFIKEGAWKEGTKIVIKGNDTANKFYEKYLEE